VDDEPNILSAVKATLDDKYDIVTASNGKEALSAAEKYNPELIIMDVMMPDMDGLEAVKKMKQGFGAKPPVIFLSAKSQLSDVENGLRLGGFAYITKPFQPSNLVKKVDDVFERMEIRKKIMEQKKK